MNEYRKQYYRDNKSYLNNYKRKYYQNNKAKCIGYVLKSRLKNHEKVKSKNREYFRNNRAMFNARKALRRARLLQATPKWADLKSIKQIYLDCHTKSLLTNLQYHVDHIIPLRGKYVSDLHVENNLQILEASENLKKGSTFLLIDDIV